MARKVFSFKHPTRAHVSNADVLLHALYIEGGKNPKRRIGEEQQKRKTGKSVTPYKVYYILQRDKEKDTPYRSPGGRW